MVNCNFCSVSHRFRVISDYLQTGNDVTPIYPLGDAGIEFILGLGMADPDLLLVVNCTLSNTVFELLAIVYKPEMTPYRFLRLVASRLIFNWGF